MKGENMNKIDSVVKTILPKRSMGLKTSVDCVKMVKDEPVNVKFGSDKEFKAHLSTGVFELYKGGKVESDLVNTSIPVLGKSKEISDDVVKSVFGVAETVSPATLDKQLDRSNSLVTDLDITKEENIKNDELALASDEALLELANSAGEPYKCTRSGCKNIRDKNSLFCSKCGGE